MASYIVRWQTPFGGFTVRNTDARTAMHLCETLLCAEQVRLVSLFTAHGHLIHAASKGTKLPRTFRDAMITAGIELMNERAGEETLPGEENAPDSGH